MTIFIIILSVLIIPTIFFDIKVLFSINNLTYNIYALIFNSIVLIGLGALALVYADTWILISMITELCVVVFFEIQTIRL